jgi:hypothetical protein
MGLLPPQITSVENILNMENVMKVPSRPPLVMVTFKALRQATSVSVQEAKVLASAVATAGTGMVSVHSEVEEGREH